MLKISLFVFFKFGTSETDLAWSSSLEDAQVLVRHEAYPQDEI